MSIHTLIPLAAATGLAGLLYVADVRGGGLPASAPVRGVMWLAARWRWQHGVRQAWTAGAELVRGMAALASAGDDELPPWRQAPVVDDAWRCPTCGIWRCRKGREGEDCGGREARSVAYWSVAHEGRHTEQAATVRWLADAWGGLAAMPVRLRRDLGRLAGMTRTPTADLGELAEDTASVRQWLAARRETSAQLVLGRTA